MTRFKRGLCALIASFLLLTTPRVLSLALDAFCKGIMKIRFKKWKIRIAQGLVLLAGSIGILIAHSSGEPAAVTGDFGEPSCNQAFCHSDNPENDGVGSITISGVPAEYVPGTPYPLTVKVNRAGQNMWGFQASARIVSSSLQAQAVVGGGFNTVFTIPNTGDTPIEGALRLRDGEGMPFDVDLILPSSDPQSVSENGQLGVVGADFALPMIPPGGILILTATRSILRIPRKADGRASKVPVDP